MKIDSQPILQKKDLERKLNGNLYISDHQNSLSLSENSSDNVNSGKKKQKRKHNEDNSNEY